ncbi:hypothetical protein [Cerasicoccus arenae]|uniref:Uncharacterized protein n=1 Tax=Cerasicoccus arenae TaxID=424488 RepID=A0A8J3DHY5_9BACT|nr:hypothetical protein [Cerasicoccus arenae]MBK1858445.1 hypothetical protein [Cerasicoccus arenae]GHC02615.1 hypothetical protein GCM10007047_19000 [Cerasicoccus arenae]
MGQLPRALLVGFTLVLALLRPLAAQDVLERTSRDNVFQIIGVDFNGTQTVGAMADQMERLGLRYYPEARNLQAPIRVSLLTEPDFDAPYFVKQQPNGNYFIYIAWNEDTRFGDVCQALASGFIRRTAVWRYGPSAGPLAPHWLELAFGQLLEAAIRPGYADVQRERALIRPPMGLEELLTARGPFELQQEKVALNAVWFFRLLENRIPDRTHFRRVLAAFLKDLNPNYVMVKAFPGQFDDQKSLEMWWAVGFQSMARSRETPFFTMEQSRELVRNLAIVTVSLNGQDRRMAGPSLWENRGSQEVQSAMELRHREIKLELQRVNPVYYNSILSLGLFFETAMSAQTAGPVNAANAHFLTDYRSAQELEMEIKRLLRW